MADPAAVAAMAAHAGPWTDGVVASASFMASSIWSFLKVLAMAAVALVDYVTDFVTGLLSTHGWFPERRLVRSGVMVVGAILLLLFRRAFMLVLLVAFIVEAIRGFSLGG